MHVNTLERSVRGLQVCLKVLSKWQQNHFVASFNQWKVVCKPLTDIVISKITNEFLRDEAKHIYQLAEQASNGNNSAVGTHERKISCMDMDILKLWAQKCQFNTFEGLDDTTLHEVLQCLQYNCYHCGELIFCEGDAGEQFYIILNGNVSVYVGISPLARDEIYRQRNIKRPSSRGKFESDQVNTQLLGRRVFVYHTGQTFGESSLVTGVERFRTASAVASTLTEVCKLPKEVYIRALQPLHQAAIDRADKLNSLQRIPLFQNFDRQRLAEVSSKMETCILSYGEQLLVERKSVLSSCYIIVSGSLLITQQVKLHIKSSQDTLLSNGSIKSPKLNNVSHSGGEHCIIKKMELQTLSAGDILALESLLDPRGVANYTASGSSASVKLYKLQESEARVHLGISQPVYQARIREMCRSERHQRDSRIQLIERAFQRVDNQINNETIHLNTMTVPPNKQCYAIPSSENNHHLVALESSENQQNFLPNPPFAPHPRKSYKSPHIPYFRPTHLTPGVSKAQVKSPTPRPQRISQLKDSPDIYRGGKNASLSRSQLLLSYETVNAIVPPRMISSCVKNFVLEHSESLYDDFADRIKSECTKTTEESSPQKVIPINIPILSSTCQKSQSKPNSQKLPTLENPLSNRKSKRTHVSREDIIADADTMVSFKSTISPRMEWDIQKQDYNISSPRDSAQGPYGKKRITHKRAIKSNIRNGKDVINDNSANIKDRARRVVEKHVEKLLFYQKQHPALRELHHSKQSTTSFYSIL